MRSTHFVLGTLMVTIGILGCNRKESKLTIDGTPRGHVEQSQFSVINDNPLAGDTLYLEGKFKISEAEGEFPFVVIEIFGVGKDGKTSVFNSTSSRTEKKANGEYGYRCEIKGPGTPGSYDVKARSGFYDVGVDSVTVSRRNGR